jgi:DNA replication protein DnaC
MLENNEGILFYGTRGTGKTFQAVSIGASLIEKSVSVIMTTVSDVLKEVMDADFGAKQKAYDRLMAADLLIIDDFRIDLTTAFSLDETYNLFNKRYLSNKPLICTTNLTYEELENPKNPAYASICDRIIEMCNNLIKLEGESRRSKNAGKKSTISGLLNSNNGGM